MNIQIITAPISNVELRAHLNQPFPDMIKFVVDVQQSKVALGGEMHADAEAILLAAGSKQVDVWGGNIYPDAPANERISFESLINIRPGQGNRSIIVQDEALCEHIEKIVRSLVEV